MMKKKNIIVIIAIFLIGLIITTASYAFWSWNSNANKNVHINGAGNLKNYVVYNEGESQFAGELDVSNSYLTGGIHSTISIYKTTDVSLLATIHMDINSIGNTMKQSSALKWVVTEGTASDVGDVLAQGNFIGTNAGDTLTLVPDISVNVTETFYTIWIWIDSNASPSSDLAGETLDTNVWTEIEQVDGADNQYEITRATARYQMISATVVDSEAKVTKYAITSSDTEPASNSSDWVTITPATDQAKVYTLNTTVNATGTYYIWFKDENDRVSASKSVQVTTIDNTAPECTWGTFNPSQIQNGETSQISLTCTDSESDISIHNVQVTDIGVEAGRSVGDKVTITNIIKDKITDGYQYTITVTGTENDGTARLRLTADIIKNGVNIGNTITYSGNISVANTYTVTYVSGNNNCPLDSTIYAIKSAGYGVEYSVANPSCNGYTFTGWTADSGLDTTNAMYGSSSADTSWSNASTPVKGTTSTYFNNLALTSTKAVTLNANYVDDIGPTGTLSLTTGNNSITATISSATDPSGVASYEYLIQTTSTCPSSGYTPSNESSYTFNISSNNTYYVCTRMVDTLGNTSMLTGSIIACMNGYTSDGTTCVANDDTPFTVNRYTHDLGTDTYTLASTSNMTGTTDDMLTLADLADSISGFTYVEGYLTGDTTRPTSGAVTTTSIAGDGSTVVNLYYRRNYLYIQYHVNGGTMASTHGDGYAIENSLVTYTDGSGVTSNKFLCGVYGSNVGEVNSTTYVVDSSGLYDYNDENAINLEYPSYFAASNKEWNTAADGSGTSYNQSYTSYNANGFAGTNLAIGDVTVILYVNWMQPPFYSMMHSTAVMDNVASTYVSDSNGINFNAINSDTNGKGIYIRSTTSGSFPIHYYRGAVTNNYVSFGGFCWKIMRTTEKGGTKLLYWGPLSNGQCTSSASTFSTKFNDNGSGKFVGYTYDSANTSSAMKTKAETWYTDNLNDYDNYIDDDIWCNDREKFGTWSTVYNGKYMPYNRATSTRIPTTECSLEADRYTVSSDNGNGLLSKKIGLPTVDEVMMAGARVGTNNSTFYMKSSFDFWTMSPVGVTSNAPYVFVVNSGGNFCTNCGTATSRATRVAITLKPEVGYIDGDGSSTSPYLILDEDDPVINYSVVSDTYNTYQNVTVSVTDTGGSGYNYMDITVTKNGSTVSEKSATNVTATSYDVNIDSNGVWQITTSAYDNFGNNATSTASYTIDTTLDTITTSKCEWTSVSASCVAAHCSIGSYGYSMCISAGGSWIDKQCSCSYGALGGERCYFGKVTTTTSVGECTPQTNWTGSCTSSNNNKINISCASSNQS